MLRSLKAAAALLLVTCLLCTAGAGLAESMHREIPNAEYDLEVSVGYDGMMTYGKTMPVTAYVRNFGGDFEGTLGVNVYVSEKEYDRYEMPVSVPAGSTREFILPVRVYARQEVFTAELARDGEVISAANGRPALIVNPSAMLIGVLSTRPQNLNYLNITRDNDVLARYEIWQTIPLTAETFPEDLSLLKSFSVLALDDLDLSLLSQKQRDALDRWLRSGRVLLLSGGAEAARNLSSFSEATGLALKGMGSSESVIESLEKGIGRKAGGRSVKTVTAEYEGGTPLISDADGKGLIYRTPVDAGRIYTAAFSLGDPQLGSDSLMHYFWQQLLVNCDQSLYNSIMYFDSENYSSASVNLGYSAGVKADSLLLPGMLMILGTLLLSCLLWWLLKKADKRQLMWIALPAVAIAATAGMILLAGASRANRPLAVLSENLVQNAAGSIRDYSAVTVAVPASDRHRFSLPGDSLRVHIYDYVEWDEEQENRQKEPDTLRTCNISGAENAVTADIDFPWSQVNLNAESTAKVEGRIEGTVWMEEDGMHAEVANHTDQSFEKGWVITTQGYVSVPALAPGETASAVMVPKTVADPMSPKYEDGGLYQGSSGLYPMVSAAMGYTDQKGYPDRRSENANSMINGAAEQLRKDQGNNSYGAFESALFIYCARPADLPRPELKVDGKPVESMTSENMMTAVLDYRTVGRTGVVYRSAGMDVPERVETDDSLMPTDKVMDSGRNVYYHALNETPTFLFRIPDMRGVKAESLSVAMNMYYTNDCRFFLYNHTTREWDEVKANEDVKDPGNYLDGEGRVYVQFRSDTQDIYAEVPSPMINLQGRTAHAEN